MTEKIPAVVLASTSPYRRELLARLLADFRCEAPAADERPGDGEPPAALAERLASAKAQSIRAGDSIVIGGDQVAALGDRVLGKPGTPDRARQQLREMAGHTVDFYTAVCVIGPRGTPVETHLDVSRVQMRPLSAAEIDRYLEREAPFDCAGSFKAERLGVALMTALDNHDPTAIQGLPLIWLSACLRRMGIPLP